MTNASNEKNSMSLIDAIDRRDAITSLQIMRRNPETLLDIDIHGNTPLHRALLNRLDMVSLLILDYDVEINAINGSEQTPFMIACICNGPIGKFIYNTNVMLNVQDFNGDTALMYLVQEDNVNGVKALLSRKDLDLSLRNYEGDTALTLSLRLERFEIARLLSPNEI